MTFVSRMLIDIHKGGANYELVEKLFWWRKAFSTNDFGNDFHFFLGYEFKIENEIYSLGLHF